MSAYDWLLKWLALAYPCRPVNEFINLTSDSNLSSEINHLGAVLFAQRHDGEKWDGGRMAVLLKQHETKNVREQKSSALPELNP